jgi:anti-anti-sigma factor
MFEAQPTGPRALRLSGELDMAAVDEFLDAARAHLDDGADCALDLAALTFVDSTGIRAIVTLAKEMRCPIILLRPQPTVRRVLELTGIAGHAGLRIVEEAADEDVDP